MPILFLTLGIVPFLLPLWTQSAFRQLWDYESRQIRLDNAAIVLGQKDRALFRALSHQVQALRALEQVHHGVHACARSGTPAAAQCAVQDRALEQQVVVLAGAIEAQAGQGWAYNAHGAALPGVELLRPLSPPLERHRCAVCGLATRFQTRVGERSRRSAFRWSGPERIEVRVAVSLEGDRFEPAAWDYRLEAE